jgi:hypothetical protein
MEKADVEEGFSLVFNTNTIMFEWKKEMQGDFR